MGVHSFNPWLVKIQFLPPNQHENFDEIKAVAHSRNIDAVLEPTFLYRATVLVFDDAVKFALEILELFQVRIQYVKLVRVVKGHPLEHQVIVPIDLHPTAWEVKFTFLDYLRETFEDNFDLTLGEFTQDNPAIFADYSEVPGVHIPGRPPLTITSHSTYFDVPAIAANFAGVIAERHNTILREILLRGAVPPAVPQL